MLSFKEIFFFTKILKSIYIFFGNSNGNQSRRCSRLNKDVSAGKKINMLKYTPASQLKNKCPEFSCKALDDQIYSQKDFKEKLVVFMFICNHCPYVKLIEDRILKLTKYFKNKDVRFVGICSNDAQTYPEDSFSNLKKKWIQNQKPFTYLFDEDQSLAQSFGAVCTPDFMIYNSDRKQVWRGRIDDSVENEKKVQIEEMKQAIEYLLQNKKPPVEEPSFGCSIKWKSKKA